MDAFTVAQELIGKIDPTILEAATKGLATAIGKVAGEAGIKLLGDTNNQILDGAGRLTKAAQDLLFRISQNYVEGYAARHGILKVLGMQKPVSLESVYVAVQLLNPETLRTFESVDALETAFRENNKRGFQPKKCKKEAGIKVANEEQYLMVLGGPGMGKTTFLRKVGLEALKRSKGDYQHSCIPVFLELKTFNEGAIDIENAIASEFENCGLPEYQQLTTEFLDKGKLLVLLDGLDEVPTDRMSAMVTSIQNFVDRYSQNRFIISCRIAARRNFRRFTDVAIADFDDKQIENFITNWFIANPNRGQKCLTRLNSGDYQAAKELTQTPLLLTLVCILFQRSGQFPTNRSTLYERALRVLLEEWNEEKEISTEPLYKGLDTKRKELILSRIAYDTFIEDQLFFPKRNVVNQIEELLSELLLDEKFVDGKHVLQDIEVQHGLLVARAEGIYSFSHLTIQEFLTADHIDYNKLSIENLVKDYLCDRRWREVFLLLAGLSKADELLLAMEQQIHSLMDTPKLKNLLIWVERITDETEGDVQPVGKRANALANAYAYALANANANALDDAFALAFADADADALTFADADALTFADADALAYADAFADAYAFAFADAYALAEAYVLALFKVYAEAYALKTFIEYIRFSEKFQVYREVNYSLLINELEELKQQIPNRTESKKVCRPYRDRIIQTWLEAFHLTQEMVDLSREEIEALDNYFYANLLMVECKKAAVSVSRKTWSDIESRMLLPVRNEQ